MATLQNAPALHRTWSSLASCQVLLLNQSSGIVCKKYILPAVRACAQGETLLPSKQGPCNCLQSYYAHSIPLITGINGRRQVLAGAWAFTTSIFFRNTALAVEPPDGYGIFVDQPDGYSFLYPSDWRDYVYQGQDAAYKDVIRPLENVRVNYKKTDKKDVHDLGPPDEVAKKLVTKVFAAPNQRTQIFNVKERTAEGKNYYSFDYVVSSPSYSRHCAVTLSIGNGKYYTLIAGALERRWKKMEETLHIVADSFQIFDA